MGRKGVHKLAKIDEKVIRGDRRQGRYEASAEQLRCDVVESGFSTTRRHHSVARKAKIMFFKKRGGCRGWEVGNFGIDA